MYSKIPGDKFPPPPPPHPLFFSSFFLGIKYQCSSVQLNALTVSLYFFFLSLVVPGPREGAEGSVESLEVCKRPLRDVQFHASASAGASFMPAGCQATRDKPSLPRHSLCTVTLETERNMHARFACCVLWLCCGLTMCRILDGGLGLGGWVLGGGG